MKRGTGRYCSFFMFRKPRGEMSEHELKKQNRRMLRLLKEEERHKTSDSAARSLACLAAVQMKKGGTQFQIRFRHHACWVAARASASRRRGHFGWTPRLIEWLRGCTCQACPLRRLPTSHEVSEP